MCQSTRANASVPRPAVILCNPETRKRRRRPISLCQSIHLRNPLHESTIAATLQQAYTVHDAGNLAGAAQPCQTILTHHPRHFAALHLLAVIAAQRGEMQHGDALVTTPVADKPDSAEAHSHGKFG